MELETLTLERTKFALKQAISEVLLNVDVDFYQDRMLHSVIAEFRTEIWSHKLPPEIKEEWYQLDVRTWESAWQLWKFNHSESKLFGWIHNKWPAKQTGVHKYQARVSFEKDKRVLFPEYNYPASLGSPYHQVVMTKPVWEWI